MLRPCWDIMEPVLRLCWPLCEPGRAEAEENVKQGDLDLIVVTMTQDPCRTFRNDMTPNSSEFMEHQIIRGRAMLVTRMPDTYSSPVCSDSLARA